MTRSQNVGETEKDRQSDVALAQLVDQFFQIDADGGVLRWVDGDVAVVVDGKISVAPLLDAVEARAVLQRPGFGMAVTVSITVAVC